MSETVPEDRGTEAVITGTAPVCEHSHRSNRTVFQRSEIRKEVVGIV